MANVFAITTVTDKLKAEAGNATTVFTVTNTTSRPLRGVARIKALGGTQAAWIKIEGETERDFPAGGTHQFSVSFNKPQPATGQHPAESYPFRFDAVSSRNPDEEYTEGPVVTIEIPEQKIEEKKSFPWWILIVVGILLVIGAVAAILVFRNGGDKPLPPTPTPTATPTLTPTPSPTPEKVKVPAVNGKTFAEAEKEIAQRGLKAEKVVVNAPDKEADKVFRQSPEAESSVELGNIVKLSVPDICDKDVGQCVWLGRYLLHNKGEAEGNGWSIKPEIKPEGHFLFGPYFSLQEYGRGKYRAFWEIKVEDNSKDVNVVTIDVFTLHPTPKSYAIQNIKANQFVYPNAYQEFTLDFVVTDPSLKYEFRVAYWGSVKVTVGKVGFQKM
ncbi:MAG TPA: PASTA domain-containing protein [Pyrinomonadaceae bacterium]|nr:PASTA domain-containing protein [Pyrinomonadaceae bacterium]